MVNREMYEGRIDIIKGLGDSQLLLPNCSCDKRVVHDVTVTFYVQLLTEWT